VNTDRGTGNDDPTEGDLTPSNGDGLLPDADVDGQELAPEGEAPDGEGSDDDRGRFWKGNPEELPEELYGIYTEMNRGLQEKFRQEATVRSELKSQTEALAKQQEELTRLSIQLQARLDAPADMGRQSDPERDSTRETGPSRADLLALVKEKAQSGQGLEALFDAVEQLTSARAGKGVTPEVSEKIAELEKRLSQYEGPAKINQQTRALNDAFDALKADEYPQLSNEKVVARVKAAFDGNDPAIMELLSKGMHATAVRFATERALREVTENRTITNARSRRAAAPPRDEAGTAERVRPSLVDTPVEDFVDMVLKGL
jgi:hypothetical protein